MRASVGPKGKDGECDISYSIDEVAREFDKIYTIALEPRMLEETTLTDKDSNIIKEVKIDAGTNTGAL